MTRTPGVLRWRLCFGWAAASFGLLTYSAVTPVQAEQAPVYATPKQVNDAVDKGIAYLLSLQKPDGSWEKEPRPRGKVEERSIEQARWGGETAICTYALLAAGQKDKSEPMAKAIKWLQDNDLHGTYSVGLQAQIWHLIPEANRSKNMLSARDREKDFILMSHIMKGKAAGYYAYGYGEFGATPGTRIPFDPKGQAEGSWYDRSNSQYGVLGAWALEQAGAEIPTEYWALEDAAWKKSQLSDGGWSYNEDGQHDDATPNMTAAGIATLFITQDYIMRSKGHLFDSCNGGAPNKEIEKGLAWMDKHITRALSGGDQWRYYGFYGVERIGVASGRKYFGPVDWYKTGAATIVKGQEPNGSWGGEPHDTCFALLFLVRGRAPVMMNKLIYETATKKQVDPWDERPRDTANLAKWMSHALDDTLLNWQVVNLQVAVDELHDAPILYLSGSEDLNLSTQDIDKLREFVNQGGMILGNADCGSNAFSVSFKKLGSKLFPKYEFRRLPLNHPIYEGETYHATKWHAKPAVEGLSNGVRELMLLIPEADLGRAWQLELTKIREEAFQLAGNIFLYATGRENLFEKGDTYIVHAIGAAGKEIKVARIDVGLNPDPEPGAWVRLAAVMHNERKVDVRTDTVKLGSGDALAGYKVATLTGTTKFALSPEQRQELKDYVQKGGTLIVDAAGGSSEFAGSAESELTQIFGDAAIKALAAPLPPDHAIYTDPKGKVMQVAANGVRLPTYRYYARGTLTGNGHDPRVRGIAVDGGRIGVFYSREDITAGLVGEPVDGVIGYEPSVATPLMANMVMYAVNGPIPTTLAGHGPTTAPATPGTVSAPGPTTAPAANAK